MLFVSFLFSNCTFLHLSFSSSFIRWTSEPGFETWTLSKLLTIKSRIFISQLCAHYATEEDRSDGCSRRNTTTWRLSFGARSLLHPDTRLACRRRRRRCHRCRHHHHRRRHIINASRSRMKRPRRTPPSSLVREICGSSRITLEGRREGRDCDVHCASRARRPKKRTVSRKRVARYSRGGRKMARSKEKVEGKVQDKT